MKIPCGLSETDLYSSWTRSHDVIALKTGEVHVWRSHLDMTDEQRETLKHYLSPDELQRAGRFHFAKDRDRFIVCRGLLRALLGRYLRIRPLDVGFIYGKYGKPALARQNPLESLSFSVSRSRNLVLYAFALHREVGVDLESTGSGLRDVRDLIPFFSAREAASLAALPDDARQKAFYTLWTRKEAYLKCRGTGLSQDINRVNVGMDTLGDPEGGFCNGLLETHPGSVRNLDAGRGYAAALAVEGQDYKLICREWAGRFQD